MKYYFVFWILGIILLNNSCRTKEIVRISDNKKTISYYEKNKIQKIEEYDFCNQLVKEVKYFYFSCFNCQTEVLYYKQGHVVYNYEIVTIEINYFPNKHRHTMIIEYNSKPLCLFYEWDEEGNLICEGQLLNLSKFQYDRKYEIIEGGLILVDVNSGYQREGLWLFYNINGQLIRTELYNKGNILSYKNYLEDE